MGGGEQGSIRIVGVGTEKKLIAGVEAGKRIVNRLYVAIIVLIILSILTGLKYFIIIIILNYSLYIILSVLIVLYYNVVFKTFSALCLGHRCVYL